jgi:hypothetical protein
MILENSTSFVHNFEFLFLKKIMKKEYTLSVMANMSFCGHLDRNGLNIYPNETSLEHKLQKEKLYPIHFTIKMRLKKSENPELFRYECISKLLY